MLFGHKWQHKDCYRWVDVETWPPITQADKDAVMRVLDRGVLNGVTSPETAAWQQEWAEYCGVKYCLATNSGTGALHVAVAASCWWNQ